MTGSYKRFRRLGARGKSSGFSEAAKLAIVTKPSLIASSGIRESDLVFTGTMRRVWACSSWISQEANLKSFQGGSRSKISKSRFNMLLVMFTKFGPSFGYTTWRGLQGNRVAA